MTSPQVLAGSLVVTKENSPTIGMFINAILSPEVEAYFALLHDEEMEASWAIVNDFCKYFHFSHLNLKV